MLNHYKHLLNKNKINKGITNKSKVKYHTMMNNRYSLKFDFKEIIA